MRNNLLYIVIICLLSLVLSVNAEQMTNPAADYCVKHDGSYEIQTDENGGQLGLCTFPNGQVCEEWKFFRGECKPDNMLNMPNPASEYCLDIGGKLEIRQDKNGNEVGVCKFPNKVECDEWLLFRGECQPGNQ